MSSLMSVTVSTANGGAAIPELLLTLEKLLACLASFDAHMILVSCIFPKGLQRSVHSPGRVSLTEIAQRQMALARQWLLR